MTYTVSSGTTLNSTIHGLHIGYTYIWNQLVIAIVILSINYVDRFTSFHLHHLPHPSVHHSLSFTTADRLASAVPQCTVYLSLDGKLENATVRPHRQPTQIKNKKIIWATSSGQIVKSEQGERFPLPSPFSLPPLSFFLTPSFTSLSHFPSPPLPP